jgi:hypothetical protein
VRLLVCAIALAACSDAATGESSGAAVPEIVVFATEDVQPETATEDIGLGHDAPIEDAAPDTQIKDTGPEGITGAHETGSGGCPKWDPTWYSCPIPHTLTCVEMITPDGCRGIWCDAGGCLDTSENPPVCADITVGGAVKTDGWFLMGPCQ